MIIDRNISEYIVFSEDSLSAALSKIDKNKHRFVLAIDESGILEGVLTDGDFRRWVIHQKTVDLTVKTKSITNKEYVSASIDTPVNRIKKIFNYECKFVPLVDSRNHLVGVARQRNANLAIGDFRFHKGCKTFIIAEIGNNHNGDIHLAKKLIDSAIQAGADCVKFQMRDMETLYQNAGDTSDKAADLGAQYTLDLLARFQLTNDELLQVFDYCKTNRILPLCTPFDINSLEVLENYGMSAYKVASADLTDHDLLKRMAQTGKPLICSTGMSTETEIKLALEVFQSLGTQYILLLCNSTYPTPFKDVNLRYLERLEELGACFVGYSGHERGYYIPLAAVGLGAKVIEKHFTLDKSLEGNDHKVSLLPEEFRDMVCGIRQIEQALGRCDQRQITQGEVMNREVLGKSLIINCELKRGQPILESMLEAKCPGKGLPPYKKADVVGQIAKRNFAAGDFLYPSDLNQDTALPRQYNFNRPFGIPVRYHDFETLSKQSNFDLVEFHLSYKDLDIEIDQVFDRLYNFKLVVHCPELFFGDHILDLCSRDSTYKARSVQELQRVIDVTRRLKSYFPKTKCPLIVVNIGGSTHLQHLPKKERKEYYDRFLDSLLQIDSAGVELIPQTMPPFPWQYGGQRYQNLFMDPFETATYCEKYNIRICLDISHSKLACNHFNWSFKEFIETVAPYVAHVHVVDAEGVDCEGLQIGEGDIDFYALAELLDTGCPDASFIPEIWQGHKNNGEGFWKALERLERFFNR